MHNNDNIEQRTRLKRTLILRPYLSGLNG